MHRLVHGHVLDYARVLKNYAEVFAILYRLHLRAPSSCTDYAHATKYYARRLCTDCARARQDYAEVFAILDRLHTRARK